MLKDNKSCFFNKNKAIFVVDCIHGYENNPFSKEVFLLFVSKFTPGEHPYMMSDFRLEKATKSKADGR